MQTLRLTGTGASSLKYDLLTALGVAGHYGSQKIQQAMMRLCSLLTARYNWKRDEFCVGQREMARMWNVTERTVKRQLKFWLDEQMLICIRQGVRGRVGAYKLNLTRIFDMTRPFWEHVGSDFAARMATLDTPKSSSVIAVDFSSGQDTPVFPEELTASSGSWGAISARLKSLYPDQYKTWFARLRLLSDESDRYILSADSRFAAQYIETHLFKTLSQAIQSEVGARRVSIKALR